MGRGFLHFDLEGAIRTVPRQELLHLNNANLLVVMRARRAGEGSTWLLSVVRPRKGFLRPL